MVCRLCLSEPSKESTVNLYKTTDDNIVTDIEVLNLIEKYLEIEVPQDDVVSTIICTDCHNHLMDFHLFRQNVQEKQKTLDVGRKQLEINEDQQVEYSLFRILDDVADTDRGKTNKIWNNEEEEDGDFLMDIIKDEVNEGNEDTMDSYLKCDDDKDESRVENEHNDSLNVASHHSTEIVTGKAEKLKMFTSRTQFERLVKELKKNPALDNYRNVTDSGNFKDRWEELAIVLNNLGTAKRLGDGWIKVWRDMKFKTKKKVCAIKAARETKGVQVKKLTALEQEVAEMFNWLSKKPNSSKKSSLFCRTNLPSRRGVSAKPTSTQSNQTEIADDLSEEEPLTKEKDERPIGNTKEPHSSTAHINAPEDNNLKCTKEKIVFRLMKALESKKSFNSTKHSQESSTKEETKPASCNCGKADVIWEIFELLSSVKRSLLEFNNYHKQLLEIEERKLTLLQTKNEREEDMHKSDVKLKNLEILIKEKQYHDLCKT